MAQTVKAMNEFSQGLAALHQATAASADVRLRAQGQERKRQTDVFLAKLNARTQTDVAGIGATSREKVAGISAGASRHATDSISTTAANRLKLDRDKENARLDEEIKAQELRLRDAESRRMQAQALFNNSETAAKQLDQNDNKSVITMYGNMSNEARASGNSDRLLSLNNDIHNAIAATDDVPTQNALLALMNQNDEARNKPTFGMPSSDVSNYIDTMTNLKRRQELLDPFDMSPEATAERDALSSMTDLLNMQRENLLQQPEKVLRDEQMEILNAMSRHIESREKPALGTTPDPLADKVYNEVMAGYIQSVKRLDALIGKKTETSQDSLGDMNVSLGTMLKGKDDDKVISLNTVQETSETPGEVLRRNYTEHVIKAERLDERLTKLVHVELIKFPEARQEYFDIRKKLVKDRTETQYRASMHMGMPVAVSVPGKTTPMEVLSLMKTLPKHLKVERDKLEKLRNQIPGKLKTVEDQELQEAKVMRINP
jgi:hypothetical protein